MRWQWPGAQRWTTQGMPPMNEPFSAADIANLLRLAADQLQRLAPPAAEDKALTVKQAAEKLNVSTDWLYRNAASLPFTFRIGRNLRFSANGLQAYLDTQQQGQYHA